MTQTPENTLNGFYREYYSENNLRLLYLDYKSTHKVAAVNKDILRNEYVIIILLLQTVTVIMTEVTSKCHVLRNFSRCLTHIHLFLTTACQDIITTIVDTIAMVLSYHEEMDAQYFVT